MTRKKTLRVATLTFHIAHNYGAMLQAYALEKTLNGLGYDCEVLDYRFPYIDQWSGIRTWNDLVQQYGFLRGSYQYYRWICVRYYQHQGTMQRRFNRFMRKRIRLSRKVYFDADMLSKADYDVIVIGSDQVWNPKLTNGLAEEYFGARFDTSNMRLVSYAASCGKAEFDAENVDRIESLLRRFHNLSVRERGLAEFIQNTYHIPVEPVMDPVFLPSPDVWVRLSAKVQPPIDEPFLLIYAFDAGEEIFTLAKKVASERKLKIVYLTYKKDNRLDDILQLTDCGPEEFVALIRKASFVCTTSFHGEAFSILLEKNFYCIAHPQYGQRNIDLLREVGLLDRLITPSDIPREITDCDYSTVSSKVEQLRQHSLDVLSRMLDG